MFAITFIWCLFTLLKYNQNHKLLIRKRVNLKWNDCSSMRKSYFSTVSSCFGGISRHLHHLKFTWNTVDHIMEPNLEWNKWWNKIKNILIFIFPLQRDSSEKVSLNFKIINQGKSFVPICICHHSVNTP